MWEIPEAQVLAAQINQNLLGKSIKSVLAYYSPHKFAWYHPLSPEFTESYLESLLAEVSEKMSAKAFLATQQRIPGLGNGVLQDTLFNAKIHPRKPVGTLSDNDRQDLWATIISTLGEMTDLGGRDTEKDLFGNRGGYPTKLSKHTVNLPCPDCGGIIMKEAYMGGSIYYCSECQS